MKPLDFLKDLALALDRISETSNRLDVERTERRVFERLIDDRLAAQNERQSQLGERVARLEEGRETIRATVRAEITEAMTALRIRYAEEWGASARKQLPKPRKSR